MNNKSLLNTFEQFKDLMLKYKLANTRAFYAGEGVYYDSAFEILVGEPADPKEWVNDDNVSPEKVLVSTESVLYDAFIYDARKKDNQVSDYDYKDTLLYESLLKDFKNISSMNDVTFVAHEPWYGEFC